MKFIIPTFITLLVAVVNSFAQANLEVTVLSANQDSPMVSDTVILENSLINLRKTAVTDGSGKVFFKGLSTAGTYVVYTRNPEGMVIAFEQDITLAENMDMSLLLIEEPVELNAVEKKASKRTVRINTTNATVSSEVGVKELLNMPVQARDVQRMLARLPNVSEAVGFFPEAPLISINSGNGLNTSYLMEGMDNNERFLGGAKIFAITSATQNVSVLTNNYSAEYGNAANGVVNVTYRSGTNEHHGEIGAVVRPNFLVAKTPFFQRDFLGNQVNDSYGRYQLTYGAGGAFKKDKLYYFIASEHAYELRSNALYSPDLNVNEKVSGLGRNNTFSAKLDYVWNTKLRSSFFMNWGLYHTEKQGGGAEAGVVFPSAASILDKTSMLYALKNQYVSANLVAETNVSFGYIYWNYDRPKIKGERPQVTVLNPQAQVIAQIGNTGNLFKMTENTIQAQQKFKYYIGKHKIKTGLELTSSGFSLQAGSNPFGSYQVQLNAKELDALSKRNLGSSLDYTDLPSNIQVLNYAAELRTTPFGSRQNIYSAYAEDAWSVSNQLTLTGGLRYDFDNLSYGASGKGDADNIAPRLSFNYKLSKRDVIRGGIGQFYDRVPYQVVSNAMQYNANAAGFRKQLLALQQKGLLPATADIDKMMFEGTQTATTSDAKFLSPPTTNNLQNQRDGAFAQERRVLSPYGYKNPSTLQINIGYQLQINKNHILTIDAIHNSGTDQLRLRNLNAPSAFVIDPIYKTPRGVSAADAARPLPIYASADGYYSVNGNDTMRGVARNIMITENGGRSEYWGLTFNYVKDRGDDKVAYRIAYTLSSLQNDTDDLNFRATDNNDFSNEWGPSLNDRTHVLSGIFYWYPTKKFSMSIASLIQSGQPVNRVPNAAEFGGTTDLNGDGNSMTPMPYFANSNAIINPDRYPGETRNSDRLPWAYTFDLGFQYDFLHQTKKGQKRNVQVRCDIFNLLNTANLSGYASNSLWTNQYQTGAAGTPISVRNVSAPLQVQFTALYKY